MRMFDRFRRLLETRAGLRPEPYGTPGREAEADKTWLNEQRWRARRLDARRWTIAMRRERTALLFGIAVAMTL